MWALRVFSSQRGQDGFGMQSNVRGGLQNRSIEWHDGLLSKQGAELSQSVLLHVAFVASAQATFFSTCASAAARALAAHQARLPDGMLCALLALPAIN